MRCLSGQFLHLTMQVDATDAHFLGNVIDTQFGIADVLVDDLHDTLHEFVVRRLDLYIVHFLFQVVVATVFQPQHLVGVDEIDDSAAQDVHVERFDDIGIGTGLQSFQLVFFTVLGGEQDDWHVAGGGIGLYLRTECVAIHLRHHDVGNKQVWCGL